MSIGQFALQTTIYSTLSNDNTLTNTLGAGVFDEVVENASYPFVALGEETAIDYSTKDLDVANLQLIYMFGRSTREQSKQRKLWTEYMIYCMIVV